MLNLMEQREVTNILSMNNIFCKKVLPTDTRLFTTTKKVVILLLLLCNPKIYCSLEFVGVCVCSGRSGWGTMKYTC